VSKTSYRVLALVVCYALVSGGCREPIDTTRTPADTGSFGQTVVTLMCQRIAYLDDLNDGDGKTDVRGDLFRDVCRLGLAAPSDAPDTLKALLARYEDLVAAVDVIFPQEFLQTLQTYLTSTDFLAIYDDDTATGAVDALIGLLRMLADSDDAMASLERLNVRLGYRPLVPALGAIRAAVNYPALQDLLLAFTQAVTEGGSARGEWLHLIDALGVTLRNTEVSAAPDDPERTANLAVDLLLTEQGLLGTSKTMPLARRDPRGLATPQAGGPFVDTDADGYADVDAVGRFVDDAGQPLVVPQPFQLPVGSDAVPWPDYDEEGRPLASAAGPLLYDYVDVDKTVLSALARDGVDLFDPSKGTAMDLMRGASALLGPRISATRTYDNAETLEYRGYDLEQSALLDMVYGFLQVLRSPQIDDILALARTLLVDHQPEVARLTEAMIATARVGDAHPEASIPADAPLWDDLIPIIRQVLAQPALVDALLAALARPEVKELGPRFHDYMTYKDRFDIDSDTQAVVGSFATPVDRTQIDNAFNRSLWQRLLMLINDSNGAVACNKEGAQVIQFGIPVATYSECEMFRVDNLAVFYLQSIAYAKDGQGRIICEDDGGDFNATQTATTPEGCASFGAGWRPRPKADFNYDWNQGVLSPGLVDGLGGDGYVEDQAGIEGMRTHPTPQALNRVLFLDPTPTFLANIIDPMRDRDGDLFNAQHAGTLPVWEKDGFYDQIRPIVQAFADSNAEQLFVDFMGVMHKHWATPDSITTQTVDPTAPGYVYGSSANSYEPLIADILSQRALVDTLVDIAPTLNAVTANAKPYRTIVRQAGSFLVTPLAGLADRRGNTTSTTSDGRPVPTLSPWQVLADAYAMKQARMAASGAEGGAWTDSISEVVDVLLRAQDVPTVGWQFRNPRMRGVSVALIDFLRGRLAQHSADRTEWLSTDLPVRLEDLLTGPMFAGVADFILSLQAAPETREQLELMLSYLVDELSSDPTGDATFRTSVTSAADLLQLAVSDQDIAPLARFAGEAIRQDNGWLDAQLVFVKKAREADQQAALSTMIVHLFDETEPGRTAIGDVIDGISEVHRDAPYVELGQRYTADDYRALLRGLADFLDEQKRGLRKFIGIIQDRNL
jgi:hypothetical protein